MISAKGIKGQLNLYRSATPVLRHILPTPTARTKTNGSVLFSLAWPFEVGRQRENSREEEDNAEAGAGNTKTLLLSIRFSAFL